MNLLDHFRPPLSVMRPWHGFHHAWASIISFDLNARLPRGYFSSPNIQYGIEIDVATFEESGVGAAAVDAGHSRSWEVPQPTQTLGLPVVTDVVETLVFQDDAGPVLVGAIELVSPANKDRPEHREAFISKCLAYLGQGVGLVLVDVVTGRRANLHDQLLDRLIATNAQKLESLLYAAAYHPVERDESPAVEIWQQTLEVGGELPAMPLCLKGGPRLALDLAATYQRTCIEQRIDPTVT
jgi:hypothetical protein